MPESIFPEIEPITPDPAPYTGIVASVAVSPRIDGANLGMAMSATLRPYRVLDGGTVDLAPESMQRTVNVGDVAGDAELAQAVAALVAVVARR